MSQPLRFLLTNEGNVGKMGDGANLLQHRRFPACRQALLQLDRMIEMILDEPLAAIGDDENLLYAGVHRLFHDILDSGLVHDGQHLFGHHLCDRQHPRSQAGGRNHCFTHFFHVFPPQKIL